MSCLFTYFTFVTAVFKGLWPLWNKILFCEHAIMKMKLSPPYLSILLAMLTIFFVLIKSKLNFSQLRQDLSKEQIFKVHIFYWLLGEAVDGTADLHTLIGVLEKANILFHVFYSSVKCFQCYASQCYNELWKNLSIVVTKVLFCSPEKNWIWRDLVY